MIDLIATAGLEAVTLFDALGYTLGGGGALVVLGGLRRVPRVLRWLDEGGSEVVELLRAVRSLTSRLGRLSLKLEAATDHYLREQGIEPPDSTGEVEVRREAVQRVVEGDTSAVIDLLDRLDPSESLGAVKVLAEDLKAAARKLEAATQNKQRERDAPVARPRRWSRPKRRA